MKNDLVFDDCDRECRVKELFYDGSLQAAIAVIVRQDNEKIEIKIPATLVKLCVDDYHVKDRSSSESHASKISDIFKCLCAIKRKILINGSKTITPNCQDISRASTDIIDAFGISNSRSLQFDLFQEKEELATSSLDKYLGGKWDVIPIGEKDNLVVHLKLTLGKDFEYRCVRFQLLTTCDYFRHSPEYRQNVKSRGRSTREFAFLTLSCSEMEPDETENSP